MTSHLFSLSVALEKCKRCGAKPHKLSLELALLYIYFLDTRLSSPLQSLRPWKLLEIWIRFNLVTSWQAHMWSGCDTASLRRRHFSAPSNHNRCARICLPQSSLQDPRCTGEKAFMFLFALGSSWLTCMCITQKTARCCLYICVSSQACLKISLVSWKQNCQTIFTTVGLVTRQLSLILFVKPPVK